MANYYMADPHFGHAKIISICGRPYTSLDEMNEALLSNILERVGADDDLWVIGDFAYKESGQAIKDIFSRIPGRKHLVPGNHDSKRVKALPWTSVTDAIHAMNDTEKRRFVLCHYPMVTWNQSRHGVLNLFGHVHNNWAGSRNSINLGVDLWDFRPVTGDEVVARARTLPVNPIWQHVEPGINLELQEA